ncbi:2-phosphosulfolactate phosphatase [Longispora sp. K20-0274]|uniref:2-phosphosulfolactate phosphatase n=1 Tax=Longispora sp. K20-0274 TaxID=3088255 RepID=UPI00399B0A3C
MTRFVTIEELGRPTGAVVVVDVFRAFSFAAWAVRLGAARIVLAADKEHARRLRGTYPDAVSCTDGPKLPDFALTNSPGQLSTVDVRGATIIQATMNGTRGTAAASTAEELFVASFPNARATARALGDRPATFVVTGGDEDRECAEFIAAVQRDPDTAPEPYLERSRGSRGAARLADGLAAGYTGIHALDVERSLALDVLDRPLRAVPAGDHLVVTG